MNPKSTASLRRPGLSAVVSIALAWSASAGAQLLELEIEGAMDNGIGGIVLSLDSFQSSPTGPIGMAACCVASDVEVGTPNFIDATGEVEFGRIRLYAGRQTLQQGGIGGNRGGANFVRGKIRDEITINSLAGLNRRSRRHSQA